MENVSRVHQPVMLDEVVSSLNLRPGYVVLDATIGGGGHAIEILKRIKPGGKLIGLDVDRSAIAIARNTLKDFSVCCKLANENFRDLDKVLDAEGVQRLDACLLDLGMSSFQLDDAARGFSIRRDARLDMRMNPRLNISAWDVVNRYSEKNLAKLIKDYGEERCAKRIARYIAYARSNYGPIDTTSQLRSIVHRAVRSRRQRIDPATRTFQAIRIEVNDELNSLEGGLRKAVTRLSGSRRIAVISFQSLEDRIIKNIFKSYASQGLLRIITRKPLTASEKEIEGNVRARSAKLRVAEKI